MYEIVNPMHPDKIADRIAGALVDLAYIKQNDPRIAVEVLIGHSDCTIIAETSCNFTQDEVKSIVSRIADKPCRVHYHEVPQDPHLAANSNCGDNGIFKGVKWNDEEIELYEEAKRWYNDFRSDGKYIIHDSNYIICQSNAGDMIVGENFIVNPLGNWTGGINVDTGATNRKLGSDMGRAVTGGGLHGKDIHKADLSVNVYLHLLAEQDGLEHTAYCPIGSKFVYIDSKPVEFAIIMREAYKFIKSIGGFEKLAEWGLRFAITRLSN